MTLTERPHNICFSRNGNEIRYVFQLTDIDRPGLNLQVKLLYKEIGSIVVNELYTWSLRPSANGNAYIYLQDYLDSVLQYVLPNVSGSATVANNQARTFYIHYREVTFADIDPVWNVSEQAYERLVIKGGIEHGKSSRNNYFINYFDVKKPFLTWQPSGRFMFADEYCYLTFLNPGINAAGFKLRTLYYLTDDSSGIITTPLNLTDAALVHIRRRIFDVQIGKPQAIVYLQLDILDANNIAVTAPYRFYCEYRATYIKHDLVYHNSLGGIDSVRVRGTIQETIERNYAEGEKGLNINQWNSVVKATNTFYTGISKRSVYKGDAGYKRTKEERDALTEILLSESIYQFKHNNFIPVINVAKSADFGRLNDKKFSLPLEWELSETNTVYTPDIDLGMGGLGTQSTLLAANDSYTFESGKLTDVVQASLNPLANDTSTAGGMIVAGVGTEPTLGIQTNAGGMVSITQSGDFTYTHPSESFTGADSCQYTITDSSGKTSTATIYIIVQ